MQIEEAAFEYELPKELIAQEPLRNRADARLMVVRRQRGTIDHFHVRDLPDLLQTGDRLVMNDTKVIAARLVGRRTKTGGRWHGLYLGQSAEGFWRIVQKTRGRITEGEAITLVDRDGLDVSQLRLVAKEEGGQWLALPETELETEPFLQKVGRVPLPPYIRGGEMVDDDVDRYQTVYAKRQGAVAAPTAGLHFSVRLLKSLERKGLTFSAVTLHVGLDTFRPISVEALEEHEMHREWGELSAETADNINATKVAGGRAIAVGTTTVRVLETAAQQTGANLAAWSGETDLFIRPPFEFRAVDALMTNFHFPRTTLLVLISTFAGRELMKEAYETAVAQRYRFYSYGDAMLIL